MTIESDASFLVTAVYFLIVGVIILAVGILYHLKENKDD
jgi:hypothetical protein